jgi:hypothetical protein
MAVGEWRIALQDFWRMKPRHFWWLYEWKSRGSKPVKRGLTNSDRNALLNWMDQSNGSASDQHSN